MKNWALQWPGERSVYVRSGHGTHFPVARGESEETTVGNYSRPHPPVEILSSRLDKLGHFAWPNKPNT